MAEIFPDNINDFVNATNGERRVFELLKINLLPNEEYIAWYEPKLQGRNQQILKPDFIVWGNSYGLIILEVKDWDIHYIEEWNDSEIKLTNKTTAKNPERQANDYMYTVMSNLQKKFELINQKDPHKGKLKFPCAYGVVLTNITNFEFENTFGKMISNKKILFSDDIMKIEDGDSQILKTYLKKITNLFPFNQLSQNELDVLRSIIFPRVIINPNKPNQQLKVLDREQEQEAWKIGPGHRIIKGVAGSGKTILIAYRAKILKALHPDYKILIICYNITLRNFIRTKINEILNEISIDDSNIEIFHFHDFAYKIIREQISNGDRKIKNIGSQDDWTIYQKKLGDILIDGIRTNEIKEGMYDAILIDECQDLTTDYLKFLLHLLNKRTNHFLIAIDPAQKIYKGEITWKSIGIQAKGRVTTLKKTYRNTKQILEFANKFNSNRVIKLSVNDTDLRLFPESAPREGNKPFLNGYDSSESLINSTIDKIKAFSQNGSFGDIGIIYQTGKFNYFQNFKNKLSIDKIPFCVIESKEDKLSFDITSNEVKLMTIHNVKGYEFKFVFLIGVDFINIQGPEMLNLIYVGITRATDELIVPYLNINKNKEYIKKMIESL